MLLVPISGAVTNQSAKRGNEHVRRRKPKGIRSIFFGFETDTAPAAYLFAMHHRFLPMLKVSEQACAGFAAGACRLVRVLSKKDA